MEAYHERDIAAERAGGAGRGGEPLGFEAGDANLHRYCDKDPADATDPTGLDAQFWFEYLWHRAYQGETGDIARTLDWDLRSALNEAQRDAARGAALYMPRTPGQPACDQRLDPSVLRDRLCDSAWLETRQAICALTMLNTGRKEWDTHQVAAWLLLLPGAVQEPLSGPPTVVFLPTRAERWVSLPDGDFGASLETVGHWDDLENLQHAASLPRSVPRPAVAAARTGR